MKTYRQHNCTRQHRTYNTLGKCMFRRAVWVNGEGPFATLAWCRVLSVSLHETKQDAEAAKDFIDRFGCGGKCQRRHEIVMLMK